MSKSQRTKGARFELEVAHLLNASRHLRCDWSESAPDIITERFIVECKRYARIAAVRWLEQCERYAERDPEGRMPIVAMREDRGEMVMMMRAEDFLALAGEGELG